MGKREAVVMKAASADGWRRALRSRRFRMAASALISLLVLVILARKIGVRFDRVLDELRAADRRFLAGTFLFSVLWHLFVGADKWWRILRSLGAKVGYWEVFRVRLGSDPIRFASPFKTGEIVNAAYFYERGGLSFGRSASSILFDKVLNYFGTWFWLFVGLFVLRTIPWMWQLPVVLVLALAGGLLFVSEQTRSWVGALAVRIHPKLRRLCEDLLSTFREFSWRRKILFLLYGVVFQIRPLLVCFLLFQAFGVAPGAREILTYGSLVVLMSNVPLTTAGIGPRETTLALLFSRYGTQDMLFSVGILMSFSIHVLPAILGLPLMPPLLRVGIEAAATGMAPEAGTPAVAMPNSSAPHGASSQDARER